MELNRIHDWCRSHDCIRDKTKLGQYLIVFPLPVRLLFMLCIVCSLTFVTPIVVLLSLLPIQST